MLPINVSMYFIAYWAITLLFAFYRSCWKVLFNQETLIEFPLITVGDGIILRCSWNVENMSSTMVGSVTTSPSIGRPRRTITPSNVTMVSPCGKWNVWVFVLHLSNKEVIRMWLTSMSGIYNACPRPACSIKYLTRGYIKSWLFRIQTPARRGLRTRSLPSHKSFVISSCWRRSSDISEGRCRLLAMHKKSGWKEIRVRWKY